MVLCLYVFCCTHLRFIITNYACSLPQTVAMLHHSRELEPIFYEFFAKCCFIKEKTDRIDTLPDCIALGKVIKALKEELKVL